MNEPRNPWKEEYAGIHLVRVREGGESFVYAAHSEWYAKQQHLSYLSDHGEKYAEEDVDQFISTEVIDSTLPFRVESTELYPAQWAGLIYANGCNPWLVTSSCV